MFRSKIDATGGFDGTAVSMVKPSLHDQLLAFPASSQARTHVKYVMPWVIPEAVAVAARDVFPVWVNVPAMLVQPVSTVEKHTS